jgi:phosphate transport system substrate-binding protein
MNVHRGLPALIVCAAMAMTTAACGGNDSSSSSSSSGSGSDSSSSAAKTTSFQGGTITGAGSTFAAPLYDQLGAEFKDNNQTTVNYQSVGSGAGVAQFIADTVDFGATDVALKDDEVSQAKAKGDPLNIPVAFGAVTVSYNVDGVDKGLKLDGPTVAKIYLGQITKWNDPAIVSQNPGVKLPDENITVVHRSDGSGTTGLFTEFLSDYSDKWKSEVGSDKTVKWPTGTGSKGNEGVAGTVKQTKGSIGYVELAYALQNDFATAAVKNKAGSYVEPTLESTSAAGAGVDVPADMRFSAINSPGAQAYPIASATFATVYKDMCKAGKSKDDAGRTQAWLEYLLGAGQSSMKEIEYAPLPSDMTSQAKTMVDGMQCNGAALGSGS